MTANTSKWISVNYALNKCWAGAGQALGRRWAGAGQRKPIASQCAYGAKVGLFSYGEIVPEYALLW